VSPELFEQVAREAGRTEGHRASRSGAFGVDEGLFKKTDRAKRAEGG
jgi:hypothetical protein